MMLGDRAHRLDAVAGGERRVALGLQAELEHPDHLGLVVDNEHAGVEGLAGSVMALSLR